MESSIKLMIQMVKYKFSNKR